MKTLENQWRKEMWSAYNYLPTRYEANEQEWQVRRFIWAFKDGEQWATEAAASIVASRIKRTYGEDAKNITVVCIPASSERKNAKRYQHFMQMISELLGSDNSFNAAHVEGERLAIHEYKTTKEIKPTQVISFDKDFFKGRRVIVFDDIITKGVSYARFANHIETFGCKVEGAIFLGRTMA